MSLNPLSSIQALVANQPKLHRTQVVPYDRMTHSQKVEYLRDKFGLYHGKGKTKRRKKGGK